MNIFKSLIGKKQDGVDNNDVPSMKLGADASNMWYDEKAKKWRFKGEEIKEEENKGPAMPPPVQRRNPTGNATQNQASVPQNSSNNQTQERSNQQQQQTNQNLNAPQQNQPRNAQQPNNNLRNNQITTIPRVGESSSQRIDPNSSVYYTCNEDKLLEEIRKNNMEILRQEKIKLEEEFKRNTAYYQRTTNSYQSKLKEMEESQNEILIAHSQYKEKVNNDLKANSLTSITQRVKLEQMKENFEIIEKENENLKKLVSEYRTLLENYNKESQPEVNATSSSLSTENFPELLKVELDEKSKIVQELLDSYLVIAQAERKNKTLLKNLQTVQNNYKTLLDINTEQERRFSELFHKLINEKEKNLKEVINDYEEKLSLMTNTYEKKLRLKDEENKSKVSNEEIEKLNSENENLQAKIRDLQEELNFQVKQHSLIVEEKRNKIEEIMQQKMALQLEIEESSQTLKQYNNFEIAYRNNINSLNDKIFQLEKCLKNFDLNTKNLKISLKETFEHLNFLEIDSKVFEKISQIDLQTSHEEIVYILKSLLVQYLKYKEDQVFYLKEKKALETDIINLKVEKDIYKEYVEEKTQQLAQVQEISNLLKEKILSLEEENKVLESRSNEGGKEAVYKLQEEIVNLKESVREKDSLVESLNNSVGYLNQKIENLEKNNHNLEKSCENLSRFEKYCEMLQQENIQLQKVILGLQFEINKKKSFNSERELLLGNIIEQALKICGEQESFNQAFSNDDKEIILSNLIKQISEIVFAFKLEVQQMNKEKIFLQEEVQRAKNTQNLLLTEISSIKSNKTIMESQIIELGNSLQQYSKVMSEKEASLSDLRNTMESLKDQLGLSERKRKELEEELQNLKDAPQPVNTENMISLDEYNILEEKLQSMMQMIQTNHEAYQNNIEKLNHKNKKRTQKLETEIAAKSQENQDLLAQINQFGEELKKQQIDHSNKLEKLENEMDELRRIISNSETEDFKSKEAFSKLLSDNLQFFNEDQQEYIKSVKTEDLSYDIIVKSLDFLVSSVKNSLAEGQKSNAETLAVKEEYDTLTKELETIRAQQSILMENLKEKETEKLSLQETISNLEMSNQTITRNYQDLNKSYETLLKESKAAEKIVEYKKKVENLVEEKLTIQNSNRLIVESLSNEIKELTTKLNELSQKHQPQEIPQVSTTPHVRVQEQTSKVETKMESPRPESNNVSPTNSQRMEMQKKQSGGLISNFFKAVFLTETEMEKI